MAKRLPPKATSDITIKKWKKSKTEEIRIVLRVWYYDPEAGDYKPGKTGLNLETRHFKNICKGIKNARKRAASLGYAIEDDH
jgi:hypothetical protein